MSKDKVIPIRSGIKLTLADLGLDESESPKQGATAKVSFPPLFGDSPNSGPPKFQITETHLEWWTGNTYVPVCSRIDVPAMTVNDDGLAGLQVIVGLPGQPQSELTIPRGLLTKGKIDQVVGMLLDRQVYIETNQQDHLERFLRRVRPEKEIHLRGMVGWWKPDGEEATFLLPNAKIGPLAESVTLAQGALREHYFNSRGTLADWQEGVARYGQGNSRLAFGLCMAFAAPLLTPLKSEGFGFHLDGSSSRGKTTCLQAAASVWGGNNGEPNADKQYIKTWRLSDSAMETIAQAHNDVLLCIDEIGEAKAYQVGQIIYMLANGEGRDRADSTGELRKAKKFKSLFFSAGEIDAEKKIEEGYNSSGVTAGQAVRFICFPSNPDGQSQVFEEFRAYGFDNSEPFADTLKKNSATIFGTAGPEFLRRIRPRLREILAQVEAGQAAFVVENTTQNDDPQVRRVAKKFGLVAAAGEVAIAEGVLPWQPGAALWAAKTCFTSYLTKRGGRASKEEDNALGKVRKWIKENDHRFAVKAFASASAAGPAVRSQVGLKEEKPAGSGRWTYFIEPVTWKSEVCKGINHDEAARMLRNKKLTKCTKDGLVYYLKREGKLVPYYAVLPEVFDLEEVPLLEVAAG